ncbi:MAG: M28 family peptidase [Anaerolineae bacterium]
MHDLIARTLNPTFCRRLEAEIHLEEIERHIRYLCQEIGVRMPGTVEERRAAEYCGQVIRDLGFDVEFEDFSYLAWAADATRVDMVSPEAKPLTATWFSHTLPTPPEGIVAPAAYVGMEQDEDWSEASGCLAIVGRQVTTSPGRRDLIGRAHAAGAVGYLEFCTATPPELAKVGNAASFLTGRREPLTPSDLPPLPAASISHQAAEEIRNLLQSGQTVELRLVVGPKGGQLLVWRTSPNVIGSVPGTDLADEIVYVIGHHDANVIGAHDNASGAAAVLALARWLKESGHRPRRTIRLFLPGCEQFGLIGSTLHVQRNPEAMANTVFAMDWGGIGDGDAMWVDRTPDAATLFDYLLVATDYAQLIPTVTQPPAVASDHAGFLWRAGIPVCELHFREFHYLFTHYDDPDHIDMERSRRSAVLGALAALGFAGQGALPLDFARAASEIRETIRRFSHYPVTRSWMGELETAVDDLQRVGEQVNALAARVGDTPSHLTLLNRALRAAARTLDPRLCGEFKLLPVLQRLVSDHAQISSLARQMPRRLIDQGEILLQVVNEREAVREEAAAEAAAIATALRQACAELRTALA